MILRKPLASLLLTVATLVFLPAIPRTFAQNTARSWLDRPLAGWNRPGSPLPRAPKGDESLAAIISRCKLTPPRKTASERAIEAAGWIPYWNLDQQLVRDGVEIVGGLRGMDGMCRPMSYNIFVFVDGRYAGSLSPEPMHSRTDGASGAVRIQAPGITAEFSRYLATDALCCPSSRVTVAYRIERAKDGPTVVPVEVRLTRP